MNRTKWIWKLIFSWKLVWLADVTWITTDLKVTSRSVSGFLYIILRKQINVCLVESLLNEGYISVFRYEFELINRDNYIVSDTPEGNKLNVGNITF